MTFYCIQFVDFRKGVADVAFAGLVGSNHNRHNSSLALSWLVLQQRRYAYFALAEYRCYLGEDAGAVLAENPQVVSASHSFEGRLTGLLCPVRPDAQLRECPLG